MLHFPHMLHLICKHFKLWISKYMSGAKLRNLLYQMLTCCALLTWLMLHRVSISNQPVEMVDHLTCPLRPGNIYSERSTQTNKLSAKYYCVIPSEKHQALSLTMATTPSISQSQKLDQVAETRNRDETHGSHTGTGICVHSLPPGIMQMQPLHFLQYCGSCNRALGPEADIYIYK